MHSELLCRDKAGAVFDACWMLGVPLLLMVVLWRFPPDGLDLWLADSMSIPGEGFPLKKNPFLEVFLHDVVKQLVVAIGILHLLVWCASYVLPLAIDRKRWLYVFLAMALATGVVKPLKELTQVHCPWSIDRYGGVEHYSSVFEPRAPIVEKSGECWPAGHAGTGFCLFALFFAWRNRRPGLAQSGLWVAIVLGSVFAVGRMLQGAHFFSHNLWSILIEWLVCAGLHCVMLNREADAALEMDIGGSGETIIFPELDGRN